MENKMWIQRSFQTSRWSGGETTELFIYPENADYRQHRFLFRISTATVPDAQSTFTNLPGVSRKLMLLEGSTTLSIEGMKICLSPDEQVFFDGASHVQSKGAARDYNVMYKEGSEVQMEMITLLAKEKENCVVYMPKVSQCFLFLYACENQVHVSNGSSSICLKQGEFGIMEITKEDKIQGVVLENSTGEKVKVVKTIAYIGQEEE